MTNQALQTLMADYPYWISFDSSTVSILNDDTSTPYLIGKDNLIIDDLPVDPSIENIRYKLGLLDNHLFFEKRYYIFSKTSFDTSRVNIPVPAFIGDPALDYIFGASTNITSPSTPAVETY
ncbi:MAG: hypothetical protein IPK03_14910 [Bacteroidetes bacterium]|nr:hypothetical protein [Bacteroidota bacterium]